VPLNRFLSYQSRAKLTKNSAVMMAGRDTTAALLGWCLLRLALHPEIFSSLRETILRDFPSDTQPDFAQLKSCRPLQHFLQEVLRLHATVPVNNRVCIKDTTLPLGGGADQQSPIAVRAGQAVTFSVYLMHRRKDLWGEDALEFRPSRWEERVPAWQWLPFLGGPRVCLGQQFALTEAGFLLVRLLREFDAVQAVDEVEMRRMRKGVGLTLCKLEEYFWLPGSIIMLTEDFNRAC
jgi:cytochrome P450